MRFIKYQASLREMARNSATKNIIIAVLLATNSLLAWGWFTATETIVLVPPTLDERVVVSANEASEGYKTAWGVYVAEMMGNITPGNAEFIAEHMDAMFAPQAYRSLSTAIADQLEVIERDRITVRFEPTRVFYEGRTEKVFVTGFFQSSGAGGDGERLNRTFEMRVDMRFGRPWVTHFVAYQGLPRTVDALERAQSAALVEAQE